MNALSTTVLTSLQHSTDANEAPMEVLHPGDDGYDTARSVWNAIVDHRPAAIARPRSVAQVQRVVRTARELGLELGIKGGGHSAVGHAVPHAGLMLDLGHLNAVTVDPVTRRARVQGGALLGDLDRATQAHGLAVTAGNVSHTGVGGLTLGGGVGWLARRYGLACDNVESFDVVTADGSLVHASADSHPDLFWALRGGGGNFGVVIEFEFRLHETGTRSLTVELDFSPEAGHAVLQGWRDLLDEAPREATLTADLTSTGVLTVGYVWTGDPTADGHRARALLPRLRSLGTPLTERILDRSYVDLQSQSDVTHAHALRRYSKSQYLWDFPDEAIDAFLEQATTAQARRAPSPNANLLAWGGAIADVPDEATAFSHRGALLLASAGLSWQDARQDEALIASCRRASAALAPFARGNYVNSMSDEGAGGVHIAYDTAQLTRLTAVKDGWDPDNIFHLNVNVPPSRVAEQA